MKNSDVGVFLRGNRVKATCLICIISVAVGCGYDMCHIHLMLMSPVLSYLHCAILCRHVGRIASNRSVVCIYITSSTQISNI